LIQVQALGGIEVMDGGSGPGLTLQIGQMMRGGNAVANGAPGADAQDESTPAQEGGDAIARGGVGANGPDRALTRSGNATGNPVIPDNPGGAGGTATANPGKGGDGIQENKPGAKGGDATGHGGMGGNQLLRNIDGGPRIGNGGDGGDIIFTGGMGGMGWSDCRPNEPVEAGGMGGMGGNTMAASTEGMAGQGLAVGSNGDAQYNAFGNGGDGGDGIPFGTKGSKGNDNSPVGAKTGLPSSFQDGNDGAPCPGEVEEVEVVGSVSAIPNGALAAGDYAIPFSPASGGAEIASGIARLDAGGFKGQNRFGAGNGQSIALQVGGLEAAAGGTVDVGTADMCWVNSDASPSNPSMYRVLDAGGGVLAEGQYTGPVSTSPGAIDPVAANCIRFLRTVYPTMAWIVAYGPQSGFIDILIATVIWVLLVPIV
jgi:hypothetical protein